MVIAKPQQDVGTLVKENGDSQVASVSIVIPCYNDTAALPEILDELKHVICDIPHISWEIIVVDDHSDEPVADFLATQKGYEDVLVITHPVNRGYGASLKTGIRNSRGGYILTMDSDGQHDPACFSDVLHNFESYDLIVGSRESAGVPLSRRPGKWFLSKLLNFIMGQKIPDMNSGLRVMRREKIASCMHLCSEKFSFSLSSTMAFCSENNAVRFVPITCRKRGTGSSRVGVRVAFATLLKILRLGVVFRPLRVFLPISASLLAVGFASFAYDMTIQNITDLTIGTTLSGLMIFCFGLMSDQIASLRRENGRSVLMLRELASTIDDLQSQREGESITEPIAPSVLFFSARQQAEAANSVSSPSEEEKYLRSAQ